MKRQLVLVAVVSVVVGVVLSQALSLAPALWGRLSHRLGGLFGGGAAVGDVISTFESDGDLKKWETAAARIERVSEHATEGRYAAKVTLLGGGQMSAIRIEDGFERRQAPRDWRRFERLEWKIFNATGDHQRLILQIKDDDGRRFKKDIWLAPNQQTDVRIFLDTVASSLNLSRIDQFSLFRWEPQGDVTLYLDDIRLLGVGQEAPATPPASSASGKAASTTALSASTFAGLLGGFEHDQELKAWRPVSAVLTRATEHVTEGHYAAKLLLRKTEEMAGLKLEDLPPGGGDWSRYQTLVLDLFNATEQPQRLLIEIKDGDGRRFKQEVFVEPNGATVAQCSLTAADASLDLARIVQLSVYQWNPDADALVYLDNVRLLRTGDPLAAAGTSTASAAAPSGAASDVISPARVPGFDTRPERWQASDPADSTRTFLRVPLSLDEQAGVDGAAWPWTGGVPFPKGTLRPETPIRLMTADGTALPLQTRPLALWDDGSIEWLLVDTQADAVAAKRLACFLDYGDGVRSAPVDGPLAVEETPEAIVVTTGPLRFSISRQRGNLFEGVWLDQDGDGTFSREEWIAGGGDLTMGHNGVTYRASRDSHSYQATIEERGPLRTVIRASGWFRDEAGNGFGQFIVRIHAFRGQPFVRLEHTFIYTGYPENKHHFVYEGLPLPLNETIEEISLELPVGLDDEGRSAAFGDLKGFFQGAWREPLELWQSSHDAFSVLTPTGQMATGQRLLGWLDVADATRGVMVALRDCWQQFPKAFEADPQRSLVTVRLWPRRSGALDLKTTAEAYGPDAVARGSAFGLAKTHEIYFLFHAGAFQDAHGEAFVRKIQEPSLVRATPEWVADSRALGWLHPNDRAMRFEEGILERLFDWAVRQRDAFHWYGMLDYGDTLTWHRDHDDDGTTYPIADWYPVGRWGWYNCEAMGTHTGALLQYVRTGQWSYFQFGEDLARHIADVDTCHYNTVANDPRLRDVIRDEYSQPGSMHRHNANHWGGRNEETSHTNIAGLALYYYLTGSWRTLDVLQEVGQFLAREPITYSQHPDIAPQRSIANLIWGEVTLYEVTGDRQHLERAGKWVNRFIESQGADGSWLETYDPTSRTWRGKPVNLYMSQYTLPALIAYHRATGDRRTAEAIVKGTDYLMTKEIYLPFFHALAYAYELTGDLRYKRVAAERLKIIAESQRLGDDPLQRGMVFQKPIYHRPNMFLYSLPYGLGLVAHSDAELQQWAQAGMQPRDGAQVTGDRGSPALQSLVTRHPSPVTSSGSYQIAVASSLVKVFRERERFPGPESAWARPAVTLSAAQGEFESAQLVFYSPDAPLNHVRLSVSPLQHIAGFGEIPSEAVSIRPVGYVQTRQPDYEVSYVGWWPDPLTTDRTFMVPQGLLAPIWLTVAVPADALPGEYRGTIEVLAAGETPRQVPLSVRVRNFALPKRGHLATAFDFYPTRLEKAYREFYPNYYRRWRANLPELEERFYQRMLDYRLSPILNLDPTQPMAVSRLEAYIKEGLTAVAIGPHGGSFDNDWPEGAGLQDWTPAYRKFAEALRQQGWLGHAYVYAYDEPPFGKPHVQHVTTMLKEADPALRTLVTFQDMPDPREWTPQQLEWLKPIDIVCGRNVTLTPQQIETLRGLGKEVWMYVSGPAPPYPTLALDYPAIAYRILPWMCWKYRVSGLLYWCVNFWRTDPWVEPMNTEWQQNGNGSLFYPGADGPVDSIRLEALRDGLEDYEYLYLLRRLVEEAERGGVGVGTAPDDLLAQARALLEVGDDLVRGFGAYTQDPVRLGGRREAIAEAIEELIGQRGGGS